MGDGNRICHMIKMRMRNKNIVRLDFVDVHRLRKRVWRNKWIEQKVFSIDFGGKTRVTVVGDFHVIVLFLFKSESSRGSQPKVMWQSLPLSITPPSGGFVSAFGKMQSLLHHAIAGYFCTAFAAAQITS